MRGQKSSPDRILRHELSPEVQELAQRADKKVAAIKLHMEQTGAGLREAKEAVEAYFLNR